MRLLGAFCGVLAFAMLLGPAAGQDSAPSKAKGDFEAFFKKLDTDKNGRLSKSEFLQMAELAKEKAKAREKLAKVYDMLDTEKQGITKERFKAYLDSKKR